MVGRDGGKMKEYRITFNIIHIILFVVLFITIIISTIGITLGMTSNTNKSNCNCKNIVNIYTNDTLHDHEKYSQKDSDGKLVLLNYDFDYK